MNNQDKTKAQLQAELDDLRKRFDELNMSRMRIKLAEEALRGERKRYGCRVLTAEDGRRAVEVFRESADEIDAALLDMTMPHLNGEETFRELRRIQPSVRVILSSGCNEQDATNRFAGKGLAGFLQKPYKPKELMKKLVEILEGTDK